MSEQPEVRPEFVTEDHLTFLDDLRKSGVTNMFGARPYVMDYDERLSPQQAWAVVSYWMKTFSERHPSV